MKHLAGDAFGTICGTKWYECFLETVPEKQRQTIKVQDRVRTYRFGNRKKL